MGFPSGLQIDEQAETRVVVQALSYVQRRRLQPPSSDARGFPERQRARGDPPFTPSAALRSGPCPVPSGEGADGGLTLVRVRGP